jgi:PKHD-type hydroxylase
MILESYCFWYKKIIPDRVCNEIVDYCLSKPKEIGAIGSIPKINSEQDKKKLIKTRDSLISFHGNENWIYNLINPIVLDVLYNKTNWNFQLDYPETFQFTEYGRNQHYHWHADSDGKPYSKGEKHVLNKIRKISVSLCLSDKKEYEGGELLFDFRNNVKKKSNIKSFDALKCKGSLVIFPSFVWHCVTPVTKGTRYSGVLWYLGNQFK